MGQSDQTAFQSASGWTLIDNRQCACGAFSASLSRTRLDSTTADA
jgi:hypothetical protein